MDDTNNPKITQDQLKELQGIVAGLGTGPTHDKLQVILDTRGDSLSASDAAKIRDFLTPFMGDSIQSLAEQAMGENPTLPTKDSDERAVGDTPSKPEPTRKTKEF